MPAKAKLTTRQESTTQVSSDNFAKGSELTYAEADSNFINLRDQSFAISDGSTTTDIEAGETITFSGATVSGNTVSITGGSSVGDFTFSGGNMYKSGDINLYSTTDGSSITLQSGEDGSNASAKIILDTRRIWVGQSNTNIDIQANGGLGDLLIANGGTYASTGSYHNYIMLTDSNDGQITISPKTGKWVDVDDVRIDDNTISTNITNGDLKLAVNGTGSIDVVASTSTTIGANGSASALTANPVGYLKIKINGTEYQLPYYNT